MHRLAILLLGAIAAAPVAAQTSAAGSPSAARHTDFSGTWNLDMSRLDPETASMVSQTSLTIIQDAKTLKMARSTTTGEQRGTNTYNLDGEFRDTVTQRGVSFERTSTTTWDGPVLVVKVKTQFQGRPAELIDRLAIDSTGKVLTIDTNITSADQHIQTTTFYHKA